MGSTFGSLEIARSAVVASQVALDIVGQNVANVNTEDYTRQTADLLAVNYSGIGVTKYAQPAASNHGQGVTVARISQIRDTLLDAKVRNANTQYSTYDTCATALTELNTIFDETSIDGLHAMLNNFYSRLSDLSENVGDSEYESLVRSAAEKVVQTLNQYAAQLSELSSEKTAELNTTVDDMNTAVSKLNQINDLIRDQTVRGSVSNELLDMRNAYLDKLSGYLNITVTPQKDGSVAVTSTDHADVLGSVFTLSGVSGQIALQRTDSDGNTADFTPTGGAIKGYLDVLNGAGAYATGSENTFRGFTYYQRALDSFAEAFAGTFNDLNTLDPSAPAALFTGVTAADIAISDAWYHDAGYLVVAEAGTNDNILKIVSAMDTDVDTSLYPGVAGSFEAYARTLISDIAVDANYYDDMEEMSKHIVASVSQQREAIMGVSIDEETINMIKYQRAYQAAARFLTVLDENLNTLINNMGIAGR